MLAQASKPRTYKFPKSFGACADRLYELRAQRSEAQRKADEIEAEEKALKNYIIDRMPKSDTGAKGRVAQVSVVTKEVPQVKDWGRFYAFVKKTGRFEFLQRRLGETAVNEMWDAKKVVPGVEPFKVVTVSLTKV